ncbi:MAG: DUF1565 domain-containing protein [Gammaproteobacteria bacterium]
MGSRMTKAFGKVFAALSVLALGTNALYGADYYVSPTGNDTNPGSESKPWRSIAKANDSLHPGDTVYLMNGEYRERIEPARSGASDRYITYQAYAGHAPVITAPPGKIAIVLNNRSYIRIDRLTIDGRKPYKDANVDQWAELIDSHHNVFQNSRFKYAKGWTAFYLQGSHYNKLINNRMDYVGTFFDAEKAEGTGDMIALHCANHNLFEGNELTRAGHDLLTVAGDYNVIRNNIFENKWGKNEGYRAISLSANRRFCDTTRGFNVFEKNIVKNSLLAHGDFRGSSADKEPMAMKVEGVNQIVRHNVFANNVGPAVSGSIRPPKIMAVQSNKIYNNVVYEGGGLWMMRDYGNAGPASNNEFKNNIVYASRADAEVFVNYSSANRTPLEQNFFTHNAFSQSTDTTKFKIKGLDTTTLAWLEENASDNFRNNITRAPHFSSENLQDEQGFRLNRGSPMIDSGDFLTKTLDAGSGKTVEVVDAGWFTDGFGIVGGDRVQIGENPPVQVSKVDYENGILFLESSISWGADQAVSLAYEGAAPDIGAYEYREEQEASSVPSDH